MTTLDDPKMIARRIQPGWLCGGDISKFQLGVDFDAMKAAGWRFLYVREGESTWSTPDDRWVKNWTGAHSAQLPCGPYHPVHGDAPGRDQARILRDRCKDWQRGRDLRPTIDLETRGGQPLHECEAMAEELELLFGLAPVLYVGKWFAREIGLTRSSPLAKLSLWLPAYTDAPELPDAWDDWLMWQLSGNGHAPGVSVACDLDVVRSEADLALLLDDPREVPRAAASDAPLTEAERAALEGIP